MRHAIRSSGLALVALFATTPHARAQSYGCESACEVNVRVGTSSADIYECKARCRMGGSGSRQSSAHYGAIAYDKTVTGWGYSDHWGSRAKAESVAMSGCRAEGKACEVLVWFQGKCGAVASAAGSKAYSGLGPNDRLARADAMKDCAAAGSRDCSVEVSHCSL